MMFALLQGYTSVVEGGQVLSVSARDYYISVAANLLYYLYQLSRYNVYVLIIYKQCVICLGEQNNN